MRSSNDTARVHQAAWRRGCGVAFAKLTGGYPAGAAGAVSNFAQTARLSIGTILPLCRINQPNRGRDNHENSLHSSIIDARRHRRRRHCGARAARSSQAESLECQRARNARCRSPSRVTSLLFRLRKRLPVVALFNTGGGRIVAMEGAAPPKSVAITEWDNLEQAQEFYNSAAWKDLTPQREKASRQYGGTSSKPRIRPFPGSTRSAPKLATTAPTEAASLGGLVS